jgi:sterol carrier protein 2
VFNVNNNCSSGSSALMLARSLVHSGYQCVLAVGFEKMERGLSSRYPDKSSPVEWHFDSLVNMGASPDLINPHVNKMTSETVKMFAYAARVHSEQYGTTQRQYAKITQKNRRHGAMNPKATFQKVLSLEDIERRALCEPITLAMSASTADGSAAVVVCSEEFVRSRGLENQAVEVLAQHMRTDLPSSFKQFKNLCGYEMSKMATEACFKDTGLSIKDVDVLEVHDCFAPNELFMYEALGLCEEGQGGRLVDSGRWISNSKGGELFQLGGRWVVNPSGGLESKGHPIGATGLAQCAELCWQLRGKSERRQVEGARYGLQQNMGLGSSAVVTLYGKYKENTRVRAKL